MKIYTTLITLSFAFTTFSQAVRIEEKSTSFNAGSKNAICITIPHTSSDFVEKKVKEEMKNWNGKYNSSKGESLTSLSLLKEIGEKTFDGYAKIIESKDGMTTVAFAFDLGGAFLSSSQHKEQYNAMLQRLKTFGINTSKEAVGEVIREQEKSLKTIQREQESLEKEKATLEQGIENSKKEIEEATKKIEKNQHDQIKKKEEIKMQATKLDESNKKLGNIK
jgi:chromosome segregation ATPase